MVGPELFYGILLIAPLLSCTVLHRLLARAGSGSAAAVAGAVAGYVGIVAGTALLADPGLLRLNLDSEVESWQFILTPPTRDREADASQGTTRGILELSNGPGGVWFVSGTATTEEGEDVRVRVGFGASDGRTLFLPISLSDNRSFLGTGPVSGASRAMQLDVYRAQTDDAPSPDAAPGVVVMERRWPILPALAGALLPLPLLLGLSLVAGGRGGVLVAVPVYVAALVGILASGRGAPSPMSQADEDARVECERVAGEYQFVLQNKRLEGSEMTWRDDYAGSLSLVCEGGVARISGLANSLLEPLLDPERCYQEKVTPDAFRWTVQSGAVVPGRSILTGVFQLEGGAEADGRLGVLYGSVAPMNLPTDEKAGRWNLYGFETVHGSPVRIHRGRLRAFPPAYAGKRPCTELARSGGE